MDSLHPTFWQWWVVGVLLMVVEMLLPGAFFLWMGLAAGLVGVIVLLAPTVGFHFQLGAFALLSIAAVLLARIYLRRNPLTTDQPGLNRRSAQYIGRTLVLTEPIVNGYGTVRVDDSTWRVRGPDSPAGSTVEVVEADGAVLGVRPKVSAS
jgi:membrane protein implicated in regulation of membrane protease activity